ncbi:MAG: YrhC family protein [Bacillus sp. (in: firmicutes)]|uniref:YrhC family protein n=1 Tax=Bacillus sp. SORGH_AS_0510 TaxID=3041771 RepID=UPI0027878EA7|nr:YrhC family protein [Bacillus sp. SORGH_AS_0510]MDQ1144948.1 NhaP-type Na+/H+ or K+/H+ antiporter [Bacillus sp. SORGH_AS_0510]
MKQQAKSLYEKMVDFKRFATILLAVGVFFYLGLIIPSDTKSEMDVNIMVLSSLSFLALSILFFIQSKQCQIKLSEMDEGQDYLMKK